MSRLPVYSKAVAAFFTAAGGALGTAVTDGKVTVYEWVGVVLAAAVATFAVFRVPNAQDFSDV